MVYKPSTESVELCNYAANNGELWESCLKGTIASLKRKALAGKYDSNLAVDSYYNVACKASDYYFKDFGYRFSVTERFTAAVDLEQYFRETVFE